MSFCVVRAFGLALLCAAPIAGEEQWQPAPSPLTTRYAERVSPREVPIYEFYPRPMMARNNDARNLAGLWDFALTDAAVAQPPAVYQGRIMTPFPIESALSGVKRSVAANQKLWYRLALEVPWGADWLKGMDDRLMLRFDGVSGTASVFVNGKPLGLHEGSNDGFSFDLTDLVTAKGKHTIEIVVSATPADRPAGAEAATGICKPAWIEAVRSSHIESLRFVPDLDASAVRVTPTGPATAEDAVEVIAYDRSFEVARGRGKMGQELTLRIEKLKAWTPDRPFNYEYRATLTRGKQSLDSVFGPLAVRKVSLGKAGSAAAVSLNNAPLFLSGVLDAGWWPDGGATAPYVEALRRDIEKVKQLGFNTVRKAFRTDQPQWYFWADRLGVMVLQELPSGDAPQLLRQYPRIIAELFNHPSVVAWVLPAGISAEAARKLTAAIRKADPTRLVLGGPDGDIREIALADVEQAGPSRQATILSPIGGIQAPLPGHAWTAGAVSSPVNLTANYLALARKMAVWRTKAGLGGFIYKQLADAADDHSGLIAGDRQGIKLDLEQAALIDPRFFAAPRLTRVVPSGWASSHLPERGEGTAGADSGQWQYTTTEPKGDWHKPSFDDSAWNKGPAAFGDKDRSNNESRISRTPLAPREEGHHAERDEYGSYLSAHTKTHPPAAARTSWTGADVWLRREFTLDTAKLYEPWVVLRRAGDARVFLNDAPVAERRGAAGGCELLACANGLVGRNVLAVHAHAEAGKGWLDVGLFDLEPQRDMRLPPGIKPIVDTWMRDTCVCLGPDGIYYLVGTGTTAAWKCDGIPLYKSADLKTWQLVKIIVWRDQFKGTWLLKDRKTVSIWAPELHYIKGNYWLTFCTDWAREGGVSGTGFLRSSTRKVEGPYELVNTAGPITPGELDASLFEDDDGTVYFLSGGSSIARMKDDMSGIAEKVRRVGTEGGGTVGFEGISLFKRNGTYYLSVTDCKMPYKTYDCMVGMSQSVYGPYGKVHIAVPHGGHNVFFQDKEGHWWSTLFGGDTPEVAGPLKEQPGLLRVEFAPDGTIHPLDPRLGPP
jgi:hypothetical protein